MNYSDVLWPVFAYRHRSSTLFSGNLYPGKNEYLPDGECMIL